MAGQGPQQPYHGPGGAPTSFSPNFQYSQTPHGGYPPPGADGVPQGQYANVTPPYGQGYNEGYQPYPQQGYPPQGYPPQGYPPQGYYQQGYPPQGYAPQQNSPRGFPQQLQQGAQPGLCTMAGFLACMTCLMCSCCQALGMAMGSHGGEQFPGQNPGQYPQQNPDPSVGEAVAVEPPSFNED
ncbi:annexin A7-like isoform X2 [Galleria mellonella]|uniref:Annexin A7-like isoform X2 n=1 Tax=Galleria mellonella TaxID=7137 RepID=A0ABM3MWM4_GALME|nr:annexin A7-like isoform X2 [Galleria mellonella]